MTLRLYSTAQATSSTFLGPSALTSNQCTHSSQSLFCLTQITFSADPAWSLKCLACLVKALCRTQGKVGSPQSRADTLNASTLLATSKSETPFSLATIFNDYTDPWKLLAL